MNARTSSSVFSTLLLIAASAAILTGAPALAQTSPYKRAKKVALTPDSGTGPTAKATTTTDKPLPSDKSADKSADKPGDKTTDKTGDKSSDKVDISDLENRYWESKDTEFHVVQNRQYTKAKRFSFSLQYGPVINSTYVSGNQIGLTGNYYFSERLGVQAMYDIPQITSNTLINSFITQNQASPNYNMIRGYYGAGVSWIPFYAKMSILEQKILYFDMAITPNIGMTQYQQQVIDGSGANLNAFTYGFDISQHFYINRTFAIRWDLLNRFYSENVVKFYKAGGAGADPGSSSAQTTTFLIGIQAFY
jgi:outer membrane beta-barrel protein